MKNTTIRQVSKLTSCDYQNEQQRTCPHVGLQKESQLLLQGKTQNNGQEKEINEADFTRGYKPDEPCLDTSISSQAVGASASQQSNLGEYEQLSLWKSTPTLKQSCDRTSQTFPSIPTSETISPEKESSICSQWDSPARAHQTQELERDSSIQLPLFGEKDLDVLLKLNPASVLSNNLKELSDGDFELFLADSVWQDIQQKLSISRQQSLGRVIKDSDCLSFPTLTSGQTSTTMRPAGQTKCEKWFRHKDLIPNGSQLGSQAIALTMGFPSGWFEDLSEQYSKNLNTPSQTKPQAELEQDTSQEEQSPQDKQPSPSAESSISIPCLIRQPHKKPFEGLIVGDRGSEFDVQVDDRIVTLSKLYVFPNFPQKKKCKTDDDISPSKNSRRKKGTGSGSIYWRTIKKNGKDYQQTYYHYEIWEKGDRLVKSCEYIPKKMRSHIEKMNNEKVPVEEILKVLKNRSKRKK